MNICPFPQDVWVTRTHSLFWEYGLPYLHTPPIRRCGCSSFMRTCATPYKLLMHMLVRKHPASSCAQTNLRCGSLLVRARTVACPVAEQAAHSIQEGGCSRWPRQRCDARGVTYGSVKTGFDSQLFPLIGLCLLLKISMLLLYFSHCFLLYFRILSEVPWLLFNSVDAGLPL